MSSVGYAKDSEGERRCHGPLGAESRIGPDASVCPNRVSVICHSQQVIAHPAHRKRVLGIRWGALLAVTVCLPILGLQTLLLLDWVTGPHAPLIPPDAMGLSGGLVSGVPFTIVVDWLVRNLGGAGTWIPLVAVFPIAAMGVSRLVGGSTRARIAAATFYCINPFVFERIYAGHVALLLGYALLPFATASALAFMMSGRWSLPTPVLWWAVMTALSPHFVWIYGIVLVAAWIAHQPATLRSLGQLAAIGASFLVLTTYIWLPSTQTQLPISTRTASDLAAYTTTGDPHLGLFPNVLGLYGFWRLGPGPQLPKDVVTGWPFLLLALLFVAGVGVVWRLRRRPDSGDQVGDVPPTRRTATTLLIAGIAGYFLALGYQGPTGWLFRWAYYHVPFFAVMREPQKFLMLTALAYAVFFGWGVERLVGPVGRVRLDLRTAGAVGLAVLLPLAYTPTIFDGLAGQIGPSHFPSSWETADRTIGDGPGQVLFLPWHLYMSFPFTDERVIANPAPTSFRRSVISGDNAEVGSVYTSSTSPRSTYLEHLFAQGPQIHRFGSFVAPLGVQYVVLAKTVDWHTYSWLSAQRDLRLVMDTPSLDVWRNTAYAGVGQPSSKRAIRQISPVAYDVGAGAAGLVSLDAPYQKGWDLDGQPATQSPQGTIQFRVGQKGGVARFEPWGAVRLGYIVSGAAFAIFCFLILADRVRARRRRAQVESVSDS